MKTSLAFRVDKLADRGLAHICKEGKVPSYCELHIVEAKDERRLLWQDGKLQHPDVRIDFISLRCVSKVLVAQAIIHAFLTAGISLYSNVCDEAWPGMAVSDPISMHDLLSHSASFATHLRTAVSSPTGIFRECDFLEAAAHSRIPATGKFYSYSDIGYSVAAIVAQRMIGQPLLAMVKASMAKLGLGHHEVQSSIAPGQEHGQRYGLFNDLQLTGAALMDVLRLFVQREARDGAARELMLDNGLSRQMEGGTAVPGYAWQRLQNGMYCLGGNSETQSLYVFFDPETALYGYLLSKPPGTFFIEAMGALDVLSVNSNLFDRMGEDAAASEAIWGQSFRNGDRIIRLARGDPDIGRVFLAADTVKKGQSEYIGAFPVRHVRGALYTAAIRPGLLMRGNGNSALEVLVLKNGLAIRLNDVLYWQVP